MYSPMINPHFKKRVKKFKKDAEAKKKINKAINELTLDPYNHSTSLEGNFKGKRKHRKGKVRLIFAICEECRKLNYLPYNGCIDRDNYSDKTLMFFDVDYRHRIYR